ncbi:MAG: arylsulfatase [Thalassotalea sp.]|nr:arylsulfatase [Thalassotalea sp.]
MNNKVLPAITLTIGIIISVITPVQASTSTQSQPNIIVIMTDDLGYGDVSSYVDVEKHGEPVISTPNIDKLASSGLRFTSGYVSAATCTPSRYSFLTGISSFRTEGTGIAPPSAPAIIKPGTLTIANIAQQAGYKTAVIGKWHLGLGDPKPNWNGALKPGPLEIGFDYSFILPTTGDRVPSVYVENHHVVNLDADDPITVSRNRIGNQPTGKLNRDTLRMDWSRNHNHSIHNGIGRQGYMSGGIKALWKDEDLADAFTQKAVKFIEESQQTKVNKPFFLYFATHEIHVPRMPHKRFQGKSSLGPRGDAILAADWSVGKIIDTLDALNIRDNTWIIFTSDNGPVLDDGYKDKAEELNKQTNHRPAGVFSGSKYSPNEGGTRVPFISTWPNQIKAGVSDSIVSATDLLTSVAKLLNQPVPANAAADSLDMLDVLLGKENAEGHASIIQHAGPRGFGYREGDWKLIEAHKRKSKKKRKTEKPTITYKLYNLEDDPAEKKDLSKQQPERLETMKNNFKKLQNQGYTRPGYLVDSKAE